MKKQQEKNNNREYYTIDVLHIVKLLFRRVWVIALCGVLSAAIGFLIAAFAITPKYSSDIKLYVNNSSVSIGDTFSISTSELTAAQSLIRTYGEILGSRSTLERIIQKANVEYTCDELSEMIICEPSNYTEIMRVAVTCDDPYEASKLANTIAEVLPVRISEIIDGASMEVVDSAIPKMDKVSLGITQCTAVGLLLGVVLSTLVLVVVALMDDTVHDEEYILRNYDYPILGKVPNLMSLDNKAYAYYSQKQ